MERTKFVYYGLFHVEQL